MKQLACFSLAFALVLTLLSGCGGETISTSTDMDETVADIFTEPANDSNATESGVK